jgi:hypothetical protein
MSAVAQNRCVLCGIRPATSREHIPPESFFERPYPPNLITVPACDPCNQGTQSDDDYVRAFFATLDHAGAVPTLDSVRNRVRRGLLRPEHPGLRVRLIASSAVVRRFTGTPTPEYQVVTAEIRPEGERILNWMRKQVRGLAYHVTGQVIPRSTCIGLERTYFMHTQPPEYWELWVKGGEYALKGRTGFIGDVFRYAYRDVDRSSCTAALRLEFYGVFSFTALIFRADFAPPQRVRFPF